ncbi:MAG TPA: hypothetical protein VLB89_03195 [Gaiellaceae bacterium]|nr:hypothetical protein [Gaiellaceae bacterium]
MRSLRGLAALGLMLLGLTVVVPSASATDPFPIDGIVTLSNANFTVHYNGGDTSANCPNHITEEKAGDILGMLDRARTFYAGMGWPVPAPGVNVSIDDFAAAGACAPYGNGLPFGIGPLDRWDAFIESGNVHLDAHSGLAYPIIAHEVFHLVEDTMVPGVDQWLQEGTAEWAAVRASKAEGGEEQNPDRTLDCVGSRCGDTDFDKNGYPGWMLFEYLAERYGDGDVRAVWDQAVANPGAPGTTDLANVLPAGTSLASFFNDYTTARMTGSFTISSLAGTRPEAFATIPVGTSSGALPDTPVAVNHLAVRYVTFAHGSDPTAPCYAATLTLNVAIPIGVVSTPTYYANTKGTAPQPLTVSGSTASITVPWNTCAGSPLAYLSLPNDSLGADGREFTVSGSVSVDSNTPAAPTDPPPGVHVIGTPVWAPTSDPAPTLNVYAPEVIKVSSKTRLLRFVVFSSGDGKLGAVLGSVGLGSASLRAGNNDVRFVLPTRLFQSLRTKSVSNVLQLTSMSPAGTKGATFTRHVIVQKPPKKKPAKKKH